MTWTLPVAATCWGRPEGHLLISIWVIVGSIAEGSISLKVSASVLEGAIFSIFITQKIPKSQSLGLSCLSDNKSSQPQYQDPLTSEPVSWMERLILSRDLTEWSKVTLRNGKSRLWSKTPRPISCVTFNQLFDSLISIPLICKMDNNT